MCLQGNLTRTTNSPGAVGEASRSGWLRGHGASAPRPRCGGVVDRPATALTGTTDSPGVVGEAFGGRDGYEDAAHPLRDRAAEEWWMCLQRRLTRTTDSPAG